MAQRLSLAMDDPMLLEFMGDMVDSEVADYLPQLSSADRALLAVSQKGRHNVSEFDDEDEYWNYLGDSEDEDVSSDLPHDQGDNGSDMEDLRANPDAAGKRKASPEYIEGAGPRKKARTETDGQDITDSDTPDTSMKPQQSLDLGQKNYLAAELTSFQNFKYAASFLAEGSAGSMNLKTVLVKLLEDKYPSGQALQDDVKLVVQSVAPASSSTKAKINYGKQVLARVERFMEKLPKSKTYGGAEGGSAVSATKKFVPGPTEAQVREKKYALEQVAAFRNRTQSNRAKAVKNLVASKIAEERAKPVKAAEKKQRLAGLMRSILETKQSDEKSAEKVDIIVVKDIGGSKDDEITSDPLDVEESEDDEINDDPLEENIEDDGDREAEDVERDPADKEKDKGKANKSYVEHLSELSTANPRATR
jgi:hypothetical protein